jgi:hypothetical protein
MTMHGVHKTRVVRAMCPRQLGGPLQRAEIRAARSQAETVGARCLYSRLLEEEEENNENNAETLESNMLQALCFHCFALFKKQHEVGAYIT